MKRSRSNYSDWAGREKKIALETSSSQIPNSEIMPTSDFPITSFPPLEFLWSLGFGVWNF